jgi:hypothetical protein
MERALMRHAEKRVQWETAKDLDQLLLAYLCSVLKLSTADGTTLKLEWVGREDGPSQVSDAQSTLFLQFTGVPAAGSLTLQHSALTEHLKDQENLVSLGGASMRFTRESPSQRLREG